MSSNMASCHLDELRRGLTVLEAEWAAEGLDTRRRGTRPSVAGLARRPAISPSRRRTVRRAGEGLREAVLREMPDPLERIDVLENGSVIVKSRRSCALLGVPASQFGIARWNCVAVPARPWLAVPRVDHAEGTLWFSLPGGLSATLGK